MDTSEPPSTSSDYGFDKPVVHKPAASGVIEPGHLATKLSKIARRLHRKMVRHPLYPQLVIEAEHVCELFEQLSADAKVSSRPLPPAPPPLVRTLDEMTREELFLKATGLGIKGIKIGTAAGALRSKISDRLAELERMSTKDVGLAPLVPSIET